MRYLILIFVLISVLGPAYASPLQGGDGNIKATLFGATRTPLQDQNAKEEILRLDVGLIGTENATYQLVDQNNYTLSPSLYKNLQTGRQMLYFIAPKDDLFKFIRVEPSGGSPFNINWWATPKGSNGDLTVRYYGVTDWIWDATEQALVFELRIANGGDTPHYIGPENFTLLDQWGWDYTPTVGFEPVVIQPKEDTDRIKVGFSGISLQSRPAILAYDYTYPDQIIIDLEKDAGPLSDALAYGGSAAQTQAAPAATSASAEAVKATSPSEGQAASQPAGQNQARASQQNSNQDQDQKQNQTAQNQTTEKKKLSLKDQINASKNRLEGLSKDEETGGNSTVGKKIASSVEGTKERLAKARERLKENNQNQTAKNSSQVA